MFIVFLAAAVGLIVALFLLNSALMFLEHNRRALAVLLSFGVRDALLVKMVAVRIVLNFHIWMPPLLLIAVAVAGFWWLRDSSDGLLHDLPWLLGGAVIASWVLVNLISLGVAKWVVRSWRKKHPSIAQLLA